MQTASPKFFYIKLSVIFIATLFAFFAFFFVKPNYEQTKASAFGPSTSHTNAPGEDNCTACHATFPVNSGTGNLQISGLKLNYLPNQQIPVTVTLNDENAVVYGFQVVAIDSQGRDVGTYTLPTQTIPQMFTLQGLVGNNVRTYVEHTVDGIIPTQFGTKSWTFTWNTPATRVGKVTFYAAGNGANSDGSPNNDYIYTKSLGTYSGSPISNFDNDGKSDVAVWRPSNGVWYVYNSTDGNFQSVPFGTNGDKIVSADYDGDGRTDFAVWRPSTGNWFWLNSSNGQFNAGQFGQNGDIPVVGDYDGDGKSDLAVFRPSNGVWYIYHLGTGSIRIQQFGLGTDKVAQGDYDADGKTDIAVWRPTDGNWYLWKSTTNSFSAVPFGTNGDKPVQGDYDGDGKTDYAVFRPSTNSWYILRSTGGFIGFPFGLSTDKPIPADYNGDGFTDAAVYRNGSWYVISLTDGAFTAYTFGTSTDIPVPTNYIAE
jgi:hypothetical protein